MSEHGDRAAFLARIRVRSARVAPPAGPHAPPPPASEIAEARYRVLDGVALDGGGAAFALLPVFVAAATAVSAEVATCAAAAVPHEIVDELVERHSVRRAVLSAEPEAQACRVVLEGLGVEVFDHHPSVSVDAQLGVTSAIAAIAVTGSVAVDSRVAGGRSASLLPTVHLCVLPLGRLVATPADLLRRYRPDPVPSALTLITGPSRTGDIEQIMTLGVHGPTAVHIVVTDLAAGLG